MVSDGTASQNVAARCEDGSDESLASPRTAKAAAVHGIGFIKNIKAVTVQVTLRQDKQTQSYNFSRSWTVPQMELHLASGQLALRNISLLVADVDFSCEDLLIGLPVL